MGPKRYDLVQWTVQHPLVSSGSTHLLASPEFSQPKRSWLLRPKLEGTRIDQFNASIQDLAISRNGSYVAVLSQVGVTIHVLPPHLHFPAVPKQPPAVQGPPISAGTATFAVFTTNELGIYDHLWERSAFVSVFQLPESPTCLALTDNMLVVGGTNEIRVYKISGGAPWICLSVSIQTTARMVAVSGCMIAWTVQNETETGFRNISSPLSQTISTNFGPFRGYGINFSSTGHRIVLSTGPTTGCRIVVYDTEQLQQLPQPWGEVGDLPFAIGFLDDTVIAVTKKNVYVLSGCVFFHSTGC